MLTKIHVNILLCESSEQMSIYVKFMKDVLSENHKLKYEKNVALVEECNIIIQRKLPSKLTNPGGFTISCSICSLTIGHALCNFGTNINLMSLSMMRKLKYGEPKLTHMTLTLLNCSITYPSGVLKDVPVKLDYLLFLVDFVILNMPEDSETPLFLDRPFLVTCKALLDVEFGELILRFNKKNCIQCV